MNTTISALAGRLAELHATARQVESDTIRFGDNPVFSDRRAGLSRAVEEVERQIAACDPVDAREAAIYSLILAKLAKTPPYEEDVPAGFDAANFCGGAYTERPTHPQLSLSF